MWKKIDSKTILNHPRLTVIEDTVELPDGKQTPYIIYGSAKPAAMLICIKGDEVLLQLEYSYPPNEVLYQFPGGSVEPGEEPIKSAKRELIEESGLKAEKLQTLGWFYTNNRRSDHKMYVFLATDCKEVPKHGGDAEEDISSKWMKIEELNKLIGQGEIVNYTLLAGWALFNARNF